ncbi:MAG TPA: plastocyanin/azurin family copper-binding protein [Acidimicrobiales bacterium]
MTRHGLVPAAVVAGALVLAACGGDDGDLPAVEGPTSPSLDVVATEMAYDPDAVAVAAGTIEVVLRNEGRLLHDLRISDQPFIIEATAGATATGQVALEAGSYAFYCSLPGHREAGMEGVLEVR